MPLLLLYVNKQIKRTLTALCSLIRFWISNSVNVVSEFSFIRFIIFDHKLLHIGMASTNFIFRRRYVASPQEFIKNLPTFCSKLGKTNGAWIRSTSAELQIEFVASSSGPSKLIRADIDNVINCGYLNWNLFWYSFFYWMIGRLLLHFLSGTNVSGNW